MPDAFLLLTPVLMLAVLGLVRFIGCQLIFQAEPGVLPPPSNFVATPGNKKVDLSWDPVNGAQEYVIHRVEEGHAENTITIRVSGVPPAPPATSTSDESLPNGITQLYTIAAARQDEDESNLAFSTPPASATPAQALVTSTVVGTLRNNFTGVVGMLIRIGPSPLFAVGLGRFFHPGNTIGHAMKIVDATTNVDVPSTAVIIDFQAPNAAAGAFVYGLFQNKVMLNANTEYYIVSAETDGGNQFGDLNTTVVTTADATVVSGVFGDGVATYTRAGIQGQTFGPVDVIY